MEKIPVSPAPAPMPRASIAIKSAVFTADFLNKKEATIITMAARIEEYSALILLNFIYGCKIIHDPYKPQDLNDKSILSALAVRNHD